MRYSAPYAFLVFSAALFGIFYLFYPPEASPPSNSAPYEERVAYWREKVQALGGDKAYEELARIVSVEDLFMQHTQAHLFGAALYEEVGFEGIQVCDSQFEHGCFHQITSDILADQGIQSVPALSEACKNALGGCPHGIGHGVLGFIGYTINDLNQALKICDSVPFAVSMSGCHSGAFMEYNVRTMLAGANEMRSPSGEWHHPCDEFEGGISQACYFWQPSWWLLYLLTEENKDPLASYEYMASLCKEIEDVSRRWACIEGLGIVALNFEKTVHGVDRACTLPQLNESEQFVCNFAVVGMLARTKRVEDAIMMCNKLSRSYKEKCLGYVRSDAVKIPKLIEEEMFLTEDFRRQ